MKEKWKKVTDATDELRQRVYELYKEGGVDKNAFVNFQDELGCLVSNLHLNFEVVGMKE